MSGDPLPWRYRSLLLLHSPSWRRLYGDLTLSTLLEVHEADCRFAPSAAERVRFLLHGAVTRMHGPCRAPSRPWRTLPDASAVRFDQENGSIPAPADDLDAHGLRRDRPRHTDNPAFSASGAPLGVTIGSTHSF